MLKTGTGDVNVNVKNLYERNILERARGLQLFDRWADVKPLPKNEGDYQTFMRIGPLPTAPQLAEGEPPTGKKPQINQFTAGIVQFGDFIAFTDKLKMTVPDRRLVEFSDLLGDQAGETMDQYHRDNQMAGTQVRYANNVAGRSSVEAQPSSTDMDAIERILDGNDTKLIKDQITATTKVATEPVPAAYVALTHVNTRQNWQDLSGFIPVHKYSSTRGVVDGELGTFGRTRIIATTLAPVFEGAGSGNTTGNLATGGSNDVYVTLIFGAHFYGSMPLQKAGIENIVKQLGNAGFDPLNQYGTTGWKAFTGGLILNEAFGVRYEHAVKSL